MSKDYIFPSDSKVVTSGFRTSSRPTHNGVDLANTNGAGNVYAFADGVVTAQYKYDGNCYNWGSGNIRMGNALFIRHDGLGLRSDYQHLKSFAPGIKVGSVVKKGQVIGTIGNTGASAGAHLHFGLHNGRDYINPMTYLNNAGDAGSAGTQTGGDEIMKMSSDNIRIKIGPMSGGDLDTMYKFADKLVGAEKKGGYVITGYANAGDQNTILQKAMSLGLEFRPYIENVGSVTVDVFANATAQASGGKVFNVQVFDKPDVNSVLANNVPDGRYWCNETNVPLANLGGGFVGAEIVYEGKPAWIGIIPGATEIAPISQRDAYTRFVKNGNNGYTEAELAAAIEAATAKSKEQLAAEQKARQEAEAKIKAAQQALG